MNPSANSPQLRSSGQSQSTTEFAAFLNFPRFARNIQRDPNEPITEPGAFPQNKRKINSKNKRQDKYKTNTKQKNDQRPIATSSTTPRPRPTLHSHHPNHSRRGHRRQHHNLQPPSRCPAEAAALSSLRRTDRRVAHRSGRGHQGPRD